MERCFVIQPFDGGTFDDRFEDVFSPALKAANLEAYRVDRDPKVSIPIQVIESEIRAARICLADMTLDNPNVWFELGYAIASLKEVILICSTDRTTKFPFDVQHRSIIEYNTGSTRDFNQLQDRITEKALALLDKEDTIDAALSVSMNQKIHGLGQQEIATLAAIAENLPSPTGSAAANRVQRDMERAGFNNVFTAIGLKSLCFQGMVIEEEQSDEEGYLYPAYRLTEEGWRWMLSNRDEFVQKKLRPSRELPPVPDDDIPF